MSLLSPLGKRKKLLNPDRICQAEELCEIEMRPGKLGQMLGLGRQSIAGALHHIQDHEPLSMGTMSYSLLSLCAWHTAGV